MKATTAESAALQERCPAWLTPEQRKARGEFDIDAEMDRLPPLSTDRNNGEPRDRAEHRGSAGTRLRPHLRAAINDDLLREIARDTLGAQRCSAQYLDALRVVLGNQANAERRGYLLEMNQRVAFTTPKTMRTIIDQMRVAGVTFGKPAMLGNGCSQVMQCFGRRAARSTDATAAVQYEAMSRKHEGEVIYSPWCVAINPKLMGPPCLQVDPADVPY